MTVHKCTRHRSRYIHKLMHMGCNVALRANGEHTGEAHLNRTMWYPAPLRTQSKTAKTKRSLTKKTKLLDSLLHGNLKESPCDQQLPAHCHPVTIELLAKPARSRSLCLSITPSHPESP